jgi:hypothetical protein
MERRACCHCGSLRVAVTGEPTAVNVCHCQACQRRTGAIMHSGVYFKESQVRIDGPEKIYTRTAQEGRKMNFHFYPNRGSSVYWNADIRPGECGIAVGAFANPSFPPPAYPVWEEFKHAWVHLPDGIQHFDRVAFSDAVVVGSSADNGASCRFMALLYGPAVRCKPNVKIWR